MRNSRFVILSLMKYINVLICKYVLMYYRSVKLGEVKVVLALLCNGPCLLGLILFFHRRSTFSL